MTKYFAIAMLTILMCTMGACQGSKYHRAEAGMGYAGIDVSHHQKAIDWAKVACDRNVTFVYVKATEGATVTDSCYDHNIQCASNEGLKVGSYHFFSPFSTVDAQFANFHAALQRHHQDLIPMIDVEVSGSLSRSQLIDSVTRLASLIEEFYKRKPMIYSMMDFYNSMLAPQLNSYPLYIGRYSTAKPQIKWNGRCTMWQFSEDGIVTGINERVDLAPFNKGKSLKDIEL